MKVTKVILKQLNSLVIMVTGFMIIINAVAVTPAMLTFYGNVSADDRIQAIALGAMPSVTLLVCLYWGVRIAYFGLFNTKKGDDNNGQD